MEDDEADEVAGDHVSALGERVLHGEEPVAPATQHGGNTKSSQPCLRAVPHDGKHDSDQLSDVGSIHAEDDSVVCCQCLGVKRAP